MGANGVYGVYASGSTVYAGTNGGGLSISTDGGASFTNKTTSNGLGGISVYGVYASGSTVYAATSGGLSISTDGGVSFTNKTTTNGLGSNSVYGVYASGSTVYAATTGGLSISTDGGASFTNKTTSNGLGANFIYGVYASGSTVYAATSGGLSITTDGGASFTNKITTNGLGNNRVNGVYVFGSTVYAATNGGGLSISTDGGASYTNYTTSNGLGNNSVNGVYASGSTVYAATSGGLSSCSAISCTPTTSTQTVSACGSYVWNGTTYTASNNTATYVTTNAGGCDSTVTLNLTIKQPSTSTTSISNCGSYSWNGQSYSTSGTYSWTGTNAELCDSVATLSLTINQASTSTSTETATGSYVWNGNTYTSSGTYTYQTTNAAGCDSTATLNLTINPAVCTPTSSSDTIAACFSYTWNGVTYSTSGTKVWNGTNAAGCDSAATLILTISTSNPYSPYRVIQTVVSNVCSSRVYRYTASVAPVGTTYNWILPTSIGGVSGVTVDSGDINSSRTLLVRYTSNEAAFITDSIKVRSSNGCASKYAALKLTNIKLSVPTAPATITVTNIGASICSNRRYRFTAPALPSGTNSSNSTILPATGYLWSFVGNLREFAFIDSGDENSQNIVVSFSSNAAAVTGDSIKLQYLSSCGNSLPRALKLTNTKLNAPAAPTTITITALQTNVCGARRYRYTAPNLPVATTTNGAAAGYLWSLVGSLSGTATIDSGNVNSQKITVTFTSNAAALTGDSIRLMYTSDCGNSARKASKLTNTLLAAPSVPATITMQIKSNECNARTYRYIAPAVLPIATSSIGAASGYLWSAPTGTVGSTGTIDSGDVNSRIITVTYTSNAAAGVGDSIRLRYTSGCGNGAIKAQKLSNVVKTGCTPISKNSSTSRVPITVASTMEVNVYPNPTTSQFNVQVKSSSTEVAVVRVLDFTGRFIKAIKVSSNTNVNIGSDLKAGAYMLEVRQGKEVKMVRVVKL